MCELKTIEYICAHRFLIDLPCDEALFELDGEDYCEEVVKTELTEPHYCQESCIYRKWRKRWVCHKCHGPNQKTPRCAINRCGHTVCRKCKPLTGPKKDTAIKIKYNALKHIKWSRKAKPARPLPRVPTYDPSVGDWM
ncbi:hypothetical protein LZ30DRAFT_777503 [Colletotrichum cereale]|nr:hypothetical protein LZ30DRAFT_777503 [Colletotrichum cereale]